MFVIVIIYNIIYIYFLNIFNVMFYSIIKTTIICTITAYQAIYFGANIAHRATEHDSSMCGLMYCSVCITKAQTA